MLAIHGLGGTGKTQIALQFAYWVKKNHPQCSVFWVSAVSAATFTQDCSRIARELSIPSENEKDKDVKELVKEYLSGEMAGPWLLIVDNVDDANIFSLSADPSMHIAYFLPKSANGFILCTTRLRQIAEDLGRERTIPLALLSNPLITDELLTELAFLPLAIAQAAAYLNRNKLPISEYLDLLRNTHEDMSELMSAEFTDLTRPQSTSNAIANTWILSFEKIRQTDQTAADLLAFVSYVEPKAIPRSILPPVPTKTRLVSAIGTLLGYAFFTKRDDNMYDMHRLHELARAYLEDGRIGEAIEVFERVVAIESKVLREDDPSRLASQHELASAYLDDGRIGEAIELFERIVAIRSKVLREDHSDRLTSQHALASAYLADGRIGEAIKLFAQVVAIESKVLREDDPSRLLSQHVLATAYFKDGRVDEAIELMDHVVSIRRTSLPSGHHDRERSEAWLAHMRSGAGITT
ncbi:TPR-like protein [Trichodelitschia bisporula]|uniref:TPR-like protein n=1 Tax=Trichodelitschia bisporula TaxID=703511 RepID=A0A6G1HJJ4_9PEZI|nr:TPR-like protein [Trichodelitschia bisporula]